MIRKFAVPIFLLALLAVTIPLFHLINSQSITMSDKKVVYELPYPGILPDHPFYFLKELRDRALDVTTRDDTRKAELYIQFSDKYLNTAVALAKKGRETQADEILISGEKYSLRVPDLFKKAKQQGAGPTQQLVDRLKQSNEKHKEVIQELMKTTSQRDKRSLEKALSINNQIKKQIGNL